MTIIMGFLAFSLFAPPISAQSGYEVKGVVLDQVGPIIGATVIELGTTTGTSTGTDGDYTLKVSSADATVEISCIGYKTLTFKASQLPKSVMMTEDAMFLDDVVVIGYGTLSKKELSSSIVQIDKDQFFKGSMNNPMEMLTGKVAGLNVSTTAAANPNSSSDLQIRGATSLSASNSPLIVIDGVPGGDIRNIAAQDIESMTVLKDAASAAIYGTRGANGVILITTRKGSSDEAGTAHITYDSWFGVNIAKPHADILSPDEFRRSRRGNDYGYNTDWYSLLMRDFSYDLNQYLAIDGSTKTGSYNASVNYKNATGLDTRAAREEFGGRIAVEQRAFNNRLQLNVSLNARRVNEEWGNDGMFDTALTMNPTMPVYNEDGSYYQPTSPTGARNPVQELNVNENNGQRLYLLGTVEAKYNIIMTDKHNLSTTVNYSLHYNDLKSNYYTPSTSGESFWGGYKGRANIQYQKWYTNHVEWLANYSMYLQDHSLQFVGGYTYEESWWENLQAGNSDFTFDNLSYNSIGSGSYLKDGKASMSSGKSLSKLIGVFGRLNYNWKDLIMASVSLRYEGSTKFGANHKWGAFPAGSVAWEIANMPFLSDHKDIVSSLKPRVSYGVTGRSDFDAYKSLSTYSSNGSYFINGSWVTGYAPSVNANPNLGWEKLVSVNAGLDFVLFGGRLRGSFDWFNRQSRDLLYNYTAPQPPFVWSDILVNVGTTSNSGVELNLEGDIFAKKDFNWTMGVNYSYGTTRLSKLSNDVYNASYVEMYQKPGVGTSEYFFRIQEGSTVGEFYGYEFAGVSEAGDMLVYNKDGEQIPASTAAPEDKRYIGNGAPKHFLSWSNTFRYKNWDLNLFFRGAFDYDIFNMRKYGMGLIGCGTDNVLRDAYLKDSDMRTGGGIISSYFLERGDFFKLENVTLGYNFTPKNTKILNSLRVYLSAKNLFTLTKYSGNDPSIISSTGLTPSIDVTSAYPLATQVTLGLTMRF
ncbi:MAG: SusC/RagA family TonB-linked outer membrane protein [Bacteroidales bacterium]|nr:SusC/RagA family TonB-linked outer membrane protein [Bacteroidales bacterium]